MAVRQSRKWMTGAAIAAACVLATACSPRLDTRGNIPDPEALARIKPGEVSKLEVEEILGSPSSVAAFDNNTWYYISKKTETLAFYRPKVVESQVLVVQFDAKGVVTSVKQLDQSDARDVAVVGRETTTAGNEMTVLQQIFGNLGRFNKDALSKK